MEPVFVGEKKFYYEHHLEGRRCLVIIVANIHSNNNVLMLLVPGMLMEGSVGAKLDTDLLQAMPLTAPHAQETLLTQLTVQAESVLIVVITK